MRVEIRSDRITLDGYVNAVGRDSRVLANSRGRFVERVEPGVFARALQRASDVELRYNHSRHLGSTGTGELRLYEDAIGLRAQATITDADIAAKARKGELEGWSFTFVKLADAWEATDTPGIERRVLKEIDLSEVSILDVIPAYIATSIEQRGDDSVVLERRNAEDAPDITARGRNDLYRYRLDLLKFKGGRNEN